MTEPVPLKIQIDAVRFAEVRQRSLLEGKAIKELRGEAFGKRDLGALNAGARTLEKLNEHAAEIRAFLKLPAEARGAVLRHGAELAQLCLDQAKREAEAKAGGPAR